MAWRVAKGLLHLREQVNQAFPDRSKDSDGTIGDANHSARESDHNPDTDGVVKAMDITHDPDNGCDSYLMAEQLRASRDHRIKYIISDRKICSSTQSPWMWRPYKGSNPHDHHVHISVLPDRRHYDDESDWNLPMLKGQPVSLVGGEQGDPPTTLMKLLKSKTQWAASSSVVAAIVGALSDWRVIAVLVVGLLAAYIIYERSKKP